VEILLVLKLKNEFKEKRERFAQNHQEEKLKQMRKKEIKSIVMVSLKKRY
jgi:hypothetical protein